MEIGIYIYRISVSEMNREDGRFLTMQEKISGRKRTYGGI